MPSHLPNGIEYWDTTPTGHFQHFQVSSSDELGFIGHIDISEYWVIWAYDIVWDYRQIVTINVIDTDDNITVNNSLIFHFSHFI